MASARAKKSRAPKLPDFSAICELAPRAPDGAHQRHAGCDFRSQSERGDAEPVDHCAGRLASGHDKSPHAELNETDRDLRERAFDGVARGLAAVTRLQSPDLLRFRAGRNGDRTHRDAIPRPRERAGDLATILDQALGRKAQRRNLSLRRRDLFERRPRARPGQDCGKSAYRFERRAA